MHVDLTNPPALRWMLSAEQMSSARELLTTYRRDLGSSASFVGEISRPVIPDCYWSEMEGIAQRAKVPIDQVVCGNLWCRRPSGSFGRCFPTVSVNG